MTKEWLLNPETQIMKADQHIEKIVAIVTKVTIVSQTVIKNNAMMNTKNIKIKAQELPNNHLYNNSVVNPVIRKKIKMKIKLSTIPEIMTATNRTKTIVPITRIDIVVIAETTHKIIIDQILDEDITIDLQAHTHLDPDMTIIIKEELHLDLHIDHHTETIPIIDTIPDQDIDLVLNHKEIPLNDTIIHIDLHQDQKFIDQDLEHPHKTDNKNRINKVDARPTNDKDSTKFEILTCQITESANTITPYSWFYLKKSTTFYLQN